MNVSLTMERTYLKPYQLLKTKRNFLIHTVATEPLKKIKDITKDTQHMGVDYLRESLKTTGWGEKEITLLTALLQQHLDSIK